MGTIAAQFVILGLIAFVAEYGVEFFCGWAPARLKPFIALAFAIGFCLGFDVDPLRPAGYIAAAPWIANVFAGVVAGGGSTFVNSFRNRLLVVPAPAQAVADVPGVPPNDTDAAPTLSQRAAAFFTPSPRPSRYAAGEPSGAMIAPRGGATAPTPRTTQQLEPVVIEDGRHIG